MKRKAYQVVFPATLVAVIVAFLSTIFFASANLSFAATVKKKSPAVAIPSAVDYTEAQIKELNGALILTGEQKELWNTLTQVMRENAKDMDAITKDRGEHTEAMNAVEHLKLHIQITEAHLAQLRKFITPFEAFYVAMSDEQKQVIDTIMETGRLEKHKKK